MSTAIKLLLGLLGLSILPARSDAVWKATILHPPSHWSSVANGVSGGAQYGYVQMLGSSERAAMWTGAPDTYVELHPPGYIRSLILAAAGDVQVGYGKNPGEHALLWRGSVASMVDLHPNGYSTSRARGTDGISQVGSVGFLQSGNLHAALWRGTAASYVDLNPSWVSSSVAYGVSGPIQVGTISAGLGHAAMWAGTASSVVDLHPVGMFDRSAAMAADGPRQFGYGKIDNPSLEHALIWAGSANSVIDIHPSGYAYSFILAAAGGIQAGGVALPFQSNHACVWSGSVDSLVDLHTLLPSMYQYSIATGVSEDGNTVVGLATPSGWDPYAAVVWTRSPLELIPSSYSMVVGNHVSGGPFELSSSDDAKFVANFDLRLGRGVPQLQVDVLGKSPIANASRIDLTVESSTSISCMRTVQLFNYASGQWDQVEASAASASDHSTTVSLTNSPARYLSLGPLQTRIRFNRSAATLPGNAVGRIDYVHWTVYP